MQQLCWRLLKVRCNNSSRSSDNNNNNIIIFIAVVQPQQQQQQRSKQVFCVALLCQPKYPSAGCLTGFSPAFVSHSRSLSLAGVFGNSWLCYTNFNGPLASARQGILHVWLLVLLLLFSLSVVAPKRFAFCLFCVNLKSALVMQPPRLLVRPQPREACAAAIVGIYSYLAAIAADSSSSSFSLSSSSARGIFQLRL